MVKEIRIYIEGGGDGKNSKALIRRGFNEFFGDLVQLARSKKIGWNITVCGSRNNAFRDFKKALKSYPDAFNLLLVDAEESVNNSPWEHLNLRDNWKPPEIDDIHCHLMVQTMEAWMIADIDALKKFYGRGFKENAIPKNSNVETIDKSTLASSLKDATRNTTKKDYQKIQHASKLLKMLDADKVRKASAHCDRLFQILEEKIAE
ncbi:MAG: DUF4276 family protein [Cyanobacteria bacterium P01_D01_bin.50]